MLRSQVTISVPGTDKAIWFVFESDHEDLEDLHAELADDGAVYGQRIDTDRVGSNARRETRREPYVLGKAALCTITPVHFELLPPLGATVERVR